MTSIVEVKVTRTVSRKRAYALRTADDVRDLLALLMLEKHTGPVRIEMAQGGIRMVCVEDQAVLQDR